MSLLKGIYNNQEKIVALKEDGSLLIKPTIGDVYVVESGVITETEISEDIDVSAYRYLAIDLHISAIAGTDAPSMYLAIDRKGADGNYYLVDATVDQTVTGNVSRTMGVGAAWDAAFGNIIRVRQSVHGANTIITRSISIIGKD